MTTLRVGGLPVEHDQAAAWAAEYLTSPRSSYPAYDAYEGSGHGAALLGDADLLAPALLNVSQNPVPTYYALKGMVPALNEALDVVPQGLTLDRASDEQLDAVATLFGSLDGGPRYVRMTTLSKVLARKRPGLIPVYDVAVKHCYTLCEQAPVKPQKGRSWEKYTRAWLEAVRDDLLRHHGEWAALANLTPTDRVRISPLRALDIVAWRAGLKARKELPPKPGRGKRAAAVEPV